MTVKRTIIVFGAGATAADRATDIMYKKIIFKNCAPFNNCVSEINNTQVDNAKDIHILKPIYNLLEYSNIILFKYIWKFMEILQR